MVMLISMVFFLSSDGTFCMQTIMHKAYGFFVFTRLIMTINERSFTHCLCIPLCPKGLLFPLGITRVYHCDLFNLSLSFCGYTHCLKYSIIILYSIVFLENLALTARMAENNPQGFKLIISTTNVCTLTNCTIHLQTLVFSN